MRKLPGEGGPHLGSLRADGERLVTEGQQALPRAAQLRAAAHVAALHQGHAQGLHAQPACCPHSPARAACRGLPTEALGPSAGLSQLGGAQHPALQGLLHAAAHLLQGGQGLGHARLAHAERGGSRAAASRARDQAEDHQLCQAEGQAVLVLRVVLGPAAAVLCMTGAVLGGPNPPAPAAVAATGMCRGRLRATRAEQAGRAACRCVHSTARHLCHVHSRCPETQGRRSGGMVQEGADRCRGPWRARGPR